MDKKKWFWMIACVFIAALSIWAVVSQTKSFDWPTFQADIISSNKWWLTLSLVSMTGFIVFEGLAVRCILKTVAPDWKKERNCIIYSSADIYFSAITPSASGGQPIMAFFMARDGISMAVITSSLLLNLILYTISTISMAIFGVIFDFGFINGYNALSITMITLGFLIFVVLIIVFLLLLFKSNVTERLVEGVFKACDKIVHFKNRDEKLTKLKKTMSEYKDCSAMISGHKDMIWKAFGWNVLQRMSQTLVAAFVFLATGNSWGMALDAWIAQIYSLIGSSCLPIPGGMGAADYLLIDGFSHISGIRSAANMALLCRGISFYSCVILSAFIVVIGYVSGRKKV